MPLKLPTSVPIKRNSNYIVLIPISVLKLSILETLYSNTLSASNAAESLSIDNSPLGTNIITRLTIYYI